MQQLTKNVFVETGRRGCNHGFVVTSEGVVMIDTPQKPTDAVSSYGRRAVDCISVTIGSSGYDSMRGTDADTLYMCR